MIQAKKKKNKKKKTSIHYIPAVLGALPDAMTQEIERKRKEI